MGITEAAIRVEPAIEAEAGNILPPRGAAVGVLPRVLAYLALAMGATLQVLGLVRLFNVLQPVIDVLLIIQAVWFMVAAIVLIARPDRAFGSISTMPSRG
jgi:hypothetical protein